MKVVAVPKVVPRAAALWVGRSETLVPVEAWARRSTRLTHCRNIAGGLSGDLPQLSQLAPSTWLAGNAPRLLVPPMVGWVWISMSPSRLSRSRHECQDPRLLQLREFLLLDRWHQHLLLHSPSLVHPCC